jgi:serine/threonine protein kinase/tetratricopeptide (TPR) repeat protein
VRNQVRDSVHHSIEMALEHAITRTCRRCGAELSSRFPGGTCGACLIEAAIDPDSEVEWLRASPLIMDFGDYELLAEIGRGGQGVVFRARQKSLNRIVALKVIALGQWATDATLHRFRREAEMAASLDHPAIVPIHEFGEREGSCYFSMKLVEGEKLDELIAHRPFHQRDAAALVAKVARAVQHAHERKVLHRDIKPGNILIDARGEPQLTDFGLARLLQAPADMTSQLSGTPSYMAPEQVANETSTHATDVYGLGTVLYQLLTGRAPFVGDSSFETIRAVCDSEPPRPRAINRKVDGELETICLKCLEKSPQRRYESAEALAEDLERWLQHQPIHARPSGGLTRISKWIRRNPTKVALIASLAALAVVVAIAFWNRAPAPPASGIAVLPFENLTDDKENAFLADGIQDDILTKLAKIGGLKVISRTSVMQYRQNRDVRKIGQALNVSHLLEGSLRRNGDTIEVNCQLIDVRSDSHIWAEQYRRPLSGLLGLESEIAQKTVAALDTTISQAERSALERKPTNDLEAYQLYVQAKALTRIAGADAKLFERLERAAGLLEKAVARDPNFSLAYCSLTDVNLTFYWVPGRIQPIYRTRAGAALREAQRLAPDAGETHLAQALFYHYGNQDYDWALSELEIAARLLPNDADVFRTRARIERRLNRWNEALRHFSKAAELDPNEPTRQADVALTCRLLRRYDEVDRIADSAISAFPEAADEFWKMKGESALARGDLGKAREALDHISSNDSGPEFHFWVLYSERNFSEAERYSLSLWQNKAENLAQYFAPLSALAARALGEKEKEQRYLLAAHGGFEPALRAPEIDPSVLSQLGVIDVELGRTEEGLRECAKAVDLRPLSRDALEGAEILTRLALAYTWTGDRDQALEVLSRIVNVPNGPSYGELKFSPMWDDLQGDPRFAELVAESGRPVKLK